MLQNLTKGISSFHHDHFVILKFIMSFQMAQFIENIGVLIDYNRNPITLLNLSVKGANCKWGERHVECATDMLMKGSD